MHCSYLKHTLLQLHIVTSQVLLLQYVFMCVFVCVKAKKKSIFTQKNYKIKCFSAQHAKSHARKMQWIHPANLSPHKAHSTLYMCYYKKYCTCAVMHSNTSNFIPYLVNSVCCGSLYGKRH